MRAFAAGDIVRREIESLQEDAVRDTIRLFEATGSPVITDGEQLKPSFATYPIRVRFQVRKGSRAAQG
jgi:methionine synthase II (cobalamin-independent)